MSLRVQRFAVFFGFGLFGGVTRGWPPEQTLIVAAMIGAAVAAFR